MPPSSSVLNAIVAFFYSGIFWMMVWFVIENRLAPRGRRKPLEPFAVALMVVSAYLMLEVVAHQSMSAMPLDVPAAAAPLSGDK